MALLVPYDDDVPASNDQRMDKHLDFKASLSTAGLLKPAMAKAGPPKPTVAKTGPSWSTTANTGSTKPATTPVVADNPVVVTTPVAFPVNVLEESEAEMIEVLKLRTYIIPSVLFHKYFLLVHWDPHDKEFFITQVQAAQVATEAPVASNLDSDNDDNILTFKHILDSNLKDNAAECHYKKQHNTNAKQLLAIEAEKSKLDLKCLNNTVPSCLPDS
ncbi:hypothetical protein J132_02595 [Termitomyces sp. J132]|nr:hypothetical protein J132_02595 [Termitomyces sp. J132]